MKTSRFTDSQIMQILNQSVIAGFGDMAAVSAPIQQRCCHLRDRRIRYSTVSPITAIFWKPETTPFPSASNSSKISIPHANLHADW